MGLTSLQFLLPRVSWEFVVNRKLTFVHLHLYKCAGTSVLAGLRSTFGDSKVWEIDRSGFTANVRRHDLRLVQRARFTRRVRAVSSHRMRPSAEVSDYNNLFPILLVRDPYERLVSQYKFALTSPGIRQSEDVIMAHEQPFTAWLEWSLDHRPVINYQARVLGGQSAGAYGIEWSEILFKLRLVARFGVFESVSNWASFCQVLEEKSGDLKLEYFSSQKQNAREPLAAWKIPPFDALPSRTQKLFRKVHAVDFKIHDLAISGALA